MSSQKTESIKVRMSKYEKEMLVQVAGKMGKSLSGCIIHLIAQASAKL